jgi:hypothetical protein
MPRLLLNIAVTAVIALIILTGNVWWRQQTQYKLGEKAEKNGSFMEALTGYEYSIRMYLPLSPTVEKSAAKIWGLAESAEKRGDTEKALLAYRSLRSAFYSTRWLAQPGQEWIDRCDQKIALLVPLRKGNTP